MFERCMAIIVPTVFALIAVVGFIGNLLVILVVLLNRYMRSTTNVLILVLAVADLLFIVICVPFTAMAIVMPQWPFGLWWCRIYQYAINVTVYAGVYTLVLMSFVRYLAIVHPLGTFSRKFRRKPCIITTIAIIWIIIVSANVPILFEYEVLEYTYEGEKRSFCVNIKMMNGKHGRLFYGCFFAFGFALPLSVICVLYGLLLRRLMRGFATGGQGANNSSGQSTENPRSKRRITRMVVIIVVIFAICWFPLQAISLSIHLGYYPDNVVFRAIQLASNCLAYTNSCVNPVFYAFLSKSFRKSFRDVICCLNSRLKKRTRMSAYQSARSHSYTASD